MKNWLELIFYNEKSDSFGSLWSNYNQYSKDLKIRKIEIHAELVELAARLV